MSARRAPRSHVVGVTIYDVAARAGVSISTVSLALNNPSRVSAKTRERVLSSADELGFVPRSEAVSRARRSVGRVGVVAPFAAYSSFGRRLVGILEDLREHSIDVVVFDEQSAATSSNPLLSSLPLTHRLDGLIVMALPLEQDTVDRLRRSTLPTVLVDRHDSRFDSVVTDDAEGGRLAAEHLLARGYDTFAFFGERQHSHDYISPSELRLTGFTNALAADGARGGLDVYLTAHGAEEAFNDAINMLSRAGRPRSVFAHDDVLAGCVIRAAKHLGLTVPEDVAVIGYDDGDVAQALDLTTIRQPLEESGQAAAALLRERMRSSREHPIPTREVRLGLELIKRDTA